MKRYEIESIESSFGTFTGISEHAFGEWVDYDDVKALAQLNKELVEALEGLLSDIGLGAYSIDLNSEKIATDALERAKELAE